MSKTPIKLILLAPERIVNIPREVAVMNTRMPRRLEKIKVIVKRIANMIIERIL